MSVDEVEPIEAEAADENAVAPRGTHLASTQTVTHEYLTQSGKVMRETVKTDGTVTLVLDFIYDESGKPFAMIDQLDHIALQVQDIIIGGKAAAVVGGIIQGERQPLIIIDEIHNRCAAAAADRLPEYRICKHYSICRILAQLAARCGGKTCIDFRKVMCYTI